MPLLATTASRDGASIQCHMIPATVQQVFVIVSATVLWEPELPVVGSELLLLCSAGSRARAQAQLNIRTGRGVTTSGRAQQTISLDWMDGCDAAGDIDGLDRLVPCVRGTCQYGAEVSALHVWNIIVEEFRVCSYIYVLYSYP